MNRPDFIDASATEIPAGKHMVMPKLDGMWVTVEVHGKHMHLFSRSGRLEKTIMLKHRNSRRSTFQGEWMARTRWAKRFVHPEHGPVFHTLWLHDCTEWNGVDISNRAASRRYQRARSFVVKCEKEPAPVFLIPVTDDPQAAWADYVRGQGYEGIVTKLASARYGDGWRRCKREITIDYVCMGVNAGAESNAGVAGSIKAGLYIDGALTYVCDVPGFSRAVLSEIAANRDQYIGRVFLAAGAGIYDGKTLRHGVFGMWRTDKQPRECKPLALDRWDATPGAYVDVIEGRHRPLLPQ